MLSVKSACFSSSPESSSSMGWMVSFACQGTQQATHTSDPSSSVDTESAARHSRSIQDATTQQGTTLAQAHVYPTDSSERPPARNSFCRLVSTHLNSTSRASSSSMR